jgi:hypothetical protein
VLGRGGLSSRTSARLEGGCGRPEPHSSGAKTWKNVGNVSRSPIPTRMPVQMNVDLWLGSRSRMTKYKITHETRKPAAAGIVCPSAAQWRHGFEPRWDYVAHDRKGGG